MSSRRRPLPPLSAAAAVELFFSGRVPNSSRSPVHCSLPEAWIRLWSIVMVRILIYLVRQPASGKQRDLSQSVGVLVVTVSASNFCHIIAAATLLYPKSRDLFRFEILFPDGTIIDMKNIVVQRGDVLAAFFVPISIGVVDSVRFVDHPVSRNQEIKMFGYSISPSPPVQAISELCDGFVTHPDNRFFRHDCTTSHTSSRGSPVFDDQERLVGISYEREGGVTKALNVEGIRHQLSQIYQGLNEMPILQILEHIKSIGEERFANLAGPSS